MDDSVFGDEVVTSTALYFRFFLSIEDLKKQAGYDALRIEKNSLNKIKSIQVAILDDLSNSEVGFKTWKKLDDSYFKIASKIKERLLFKGLFIFNYENRVRKIGVSRKSTTGKTDN